MFSSSTSLWTKMAEKLTRNVNRLLICRERNFRLVSTASSLFHWNVEHTRQASKIRAIDCVEVYIEVGVVLRFRTRWLVYYCTTRVNEKSGWGNRNVFRCLNANQWNMIMDGCGSIPISVEKKASYHPMYGNNGIMIITYATGLTLPFEKSANLFGSLFPIHTKHPVCSVKHERSSCSVTFVALLLFNLILGDPNRDPLFQKISKSFDNSMVFRSKSKQYLLDFFQR